MSSNIALSGINAINGQLGQISNNIANSGTYGFKSGRANFASSYINAQPGGVSIGSTSQSVDIGGNFLSTGRGMDVAIQGRGFFVSRDADGSTVFSRAGIFGTDQDGYLVDFMNRRVQGYSGGGQLGDLTVPTGAIPAQASRGLDYAGNLSADWEPPAVATFDKNDPKSYNHMSVATVHDSLGREHSVTQYFVKGAGNELEVHYTMDGADVGTPTQLRFDTDGALIAPSGAVALDLGTPDGASAMSLDISYAGTTLFGGAQTTTKNRADGYAAGTFTGVTLTENGSIEVQYSNGQKQIAGQLALATFANEQGLVPAEGSAWRATTDTGEPLYSMAGTGTAGRLAVGGLEESNVDMTAELVHLMSAQQDYQANSKVLSTENEMMRTLIQTL
jgi:flagellar hook protein FlgE